MTSIERLDSEYHKLPGHPRKRSTQHMSAVDVDAVRAHSFGLRGQIGQDGATYAARVRRVNGRSVDEHRQPGARPRLEEAHRVRDTRFHNNIRKREGIECGRSGNTNAVVAPVVVSDADDDDPTGRAGHSRCTVSRKKCAEHEMHGS